MTKLSERELADLSWMARVNEDGVALYGPTVKRHGPVSECEALIWMGVAERRSVNGGYWITEAGRRALSGDQDAR